MSCTLFLLFEAGPSIKEVQFRLSHHDVKITLNVYVHVTKKAKFKKIDKFTSLLNEKSKITKELTKD